MRFIAFPIGMLAAVCGLLATAAPVWAAAAETWVSGTGSNEGTCPFTAPCRTFAFAHGVTNNGGSINVLSSGNFGPVKINRSISIVADGVAAVINTGLPGGAAIIVEAAADRIVSLRGLTIDLHGTANTGISFVSGAALHVQNCVIRRSINGIGFFPASGTSELTVADSAIADTSLYGILVRPTGNGGAKVVLDRVRVENAGAGIVFTGSSTSGSITATVRDSVAAGSNTGAGIFASEGGSGTTVVMIDRTASVNNFDGIAAVGAGAIIRIGDSTVSGNATGLNPVSGGTIESFGTNKVRGNTTDGAPTGLPIAMK